MWIPAHERHAIERVSISFEFGSTLTAKVFTDLVNKAAHEVPGKGLTDVADVMEASFPTSMFPQGNAPGPQNISVGPNGIVFGGQSHPLQAAGRTFRSVRANELKEELQIHRNRIVYSTSEYDGWDSFKPRFMDLAGRYLDRSLIVAGASFAKLEYWDRFNFHGDLGNINFSELFKVESPYLPVFFNGLRDLWHSHIGFYVDVEMARKRLINFNVDVIDVNEFVEAINAHMERRSVGIYSMVQDTFDSERTLDTMEEASSTMDEMHTILKSVLTNVITTEVADRISLNRQAEQ